MLPGDQPSNIVSNRRNHFKRQIRRQQIDSYFQERRKEMRVLSILPIFTESPNIQLAQRLQDNESRQSFLSAVMKKLAEQPNESWRAVIKELKQSVCCFEGNFEVWINFRIVDKLASLMHLEYVCLDLQEEVAFLFAEMVNVMVHQRDKRYLLQIPLVQDVIILLRNKHIVVEKRGAFFQFLANLCLFAFTVRKYILQQGAGELLVEYGSALLAQSALIEEQVLYNYSGCCQQFLKVFRNKDNNYYPELGFAVSIIPVVIDLLATKKSARLCSLSLSCLQQILKAKKAIIELKIRSDTRLIDLLLGVIGTGDWSDRALGLYILNSLISTAETYEWINRLWLKDLLGLLRSLNENPNAIVVARKLSVKICTNLITSPVQAEAFIQHPIFPLFLQYLRGSHKTVRQQAYTCFQSILLNLSPNSVDRIMIKYPLLTQLINAISNQPQDHHIVLKAMQILQIYIQANHQRESDFNKAVDMLQRIYRLQFLLEDVAYRQDYPTELAAKADQLLEYIGQCVSQS